jgi:hypothetical protein
MLALEAGASNPSELKNKASLQKAGQTLGSFYPAKRRKRSKAEGCLTSAQSFLSPPNLFLSFIPLATPRSYRQDTILHIAQLSDLSLLPRRPRRFLLERLIRLDLSCADSALRHLHWLNGLSHHLRIALRRHHLYLRSLSCASDTSSLGKVRRVWRIPQAGYVTLGCLIHLLMT